MNNKGNELIFSFFLMLKGKKIDVGEQLATKNYFECMVGIVNHCI